MYKPRTSGGHNAFEFIGDCGESCAGDASVGLPTRMMIGPAYAKRSAQTLGDSLALYEASFGATREDAGGRQ